MAFLTINGLKKSNFHTITFSSLDDLKGLETELANLTFDLKESGEIGNSPDKNVTITFKFLDYELNFGYFNGRLLGDLTRAPIDAALFEKIGFSTDDEYYDPYNFFEYALEYEIEELEGDDEDEEDVDPEMVAALNSLKAEFDLLQITDDDENDAGLMTLVKHEWHQVDRQLAFKLTEDVFREIYSDLDEDEIAEKLQQLASGDLSIEEIMAAAQDASVDIDWEPQYDDWWTERKGGYEVTYEVGDETSWRHLPPALPTKKCTRCRWEGESYDARIACFDQSGTLIPEDDDENKEIDHTEKVCPMCDSALLNINPTHQCNSCDWVGQSMDTETVWDKDDDEKHRDEGDYCPDCGGTVGEI
jgi:hypothetical protein